MITFLDENDVEYGALATIKATNAVNGERSLTGTIASGDYVLSNIERGWRLRFDDEYYVVTYAKPIDEGRAVQVEFDAVHQFFWDFDKSSVYDQLADGSHTFIAYLDFIFKNSGYSYTVDSALNVHAFEKQSFGFKKRLTLFNDIITSTGVEFQVNGKVVRILEKVGTDLSTVVRKNFNMNELTIEKNIGDFVTYQKGFGAYFDEEDHSKGRLEVEYTSPLASAYGKLEAEPFVDERYSQSSSLLAALKENVDNSYTISVSLDMEDLTRAGYKYKQPIAGDYIMAINETLDFQEKIRIVSFTSEYDVDGQLIKHTVTCNDIGSVKKLSASYTHTQHQAANAEANANTAYEYANKALISADGKNTNYYGDSFPVDNPKGTLKKGDLLFLTVGDTVKQYYWNGADWVINPVLDDVEAFKEQIANELKDVPNREEFENKISEELTNSKAEITTQIETAKTQAESNAKEYADTINQETAKVAEQASTAADEIKADLINVKNNLTSTSLVANNAQAAVDAAKRDLANVNTKVDNAKEELTQAKQQLTTVADDLSQAKTDLQTAVSAVDTKATNLKSELTQAKQDLASQAQQLQTQANAQTELSKRVTTVESTANGTKTTVSELSKTVAQNGKDITSVTNRTKTVEDDLANTKTTLTQVQTTANSASQKTATLETGLNGLSAKFDNLKIGGRNLLTKTNQGKTNWSWKISSGGTTAEDYDVDGVNAVKLTRTSDASVRWSYIQYNGLMRKLIEPDTKYTLSFDVKPNVDVTFKATLMTGDGRGPLTDKVNMNKATANQWTKVSCVLTSKTTLPDESGQVVYLEGMPTAKDNYLVIKNIKLEKGNIATDYSPSEVDFEQKVAEYKQNADQNYASLSSTVQTLDGQVQSNKTTAEQTAQGFKTRIESLETYKNGESERANAYFESAKTETARQLTAERTAIAKDYVAKSTYTSDVTGIRNELSATTSTANATKTNLANYQASNDKMVASLKSSLQTTDGNVSNLQTKVEAVPGQITSAVSAVEGKIPTNVSTRNLILKSNDFANPHKQNGANTTITSTDDYFVVKSTGYTTNGWGGISWNMSISEMKAGEQFSILMPVYIDSSVNLDNGLAFHIKNHTSNSAAYFYDIPTNKKDRWFNVAFTFKASNDVVFDSHPFYVYIVKNGLIRIKPPMLVRGSLIPSDYQPAFEDTESDISSLSSELKQTADGMTLLATKTELNNAKNELQSGITTATNKANSNAQTISTHTTQISALNTGLQAKVSQSDFNTLSGRVTTAENNITAKANELSSKISSVEGKIPKNVSTRNLILKSNDFRNPHKQGGGANTTITSTDDYFVVKSTGYTSNGWGGISWNISISEVKAGEQFSILMPVYIDSSINLDSAFSFELKRHNPNTRAYAYSIPTNKKDEWFNVAITFKIAGDVKFDTYPFYVYLVKNGLVRIKPPILVRGSLIPSDYQPAFEDAESDIAKLSTTLTQTSNGLKQLSTQVTSQGNTITSHTNSINSLTTGLQAKVSQSDFNTLSGRVTTAENNITAKANELSSKITSVEGKIPTTVGGRNYVLGTGTAKSSTGGKLYDLSSAFDGIADNATLILEFDWSVTAPTSTSKFRINRVITYSDGKSESWSNTIVLNGVSDDVRTSSGSGHYSSAFKKIAYDKTNVASRYLNLNQTTASGTVTISNLSIRVGSLKSDWEPAPEDYDSKLASAQSEIKQTTDSIKASVSSLDKSTVKSSSLTINSDGIVMKAGKSTTDVANAIGSYFSVNQNAINLFSDKINVKANMIVDGAITSTKIASKSINTSHLNGKIITADVISSNAVTADAIKAGAVTTDKMSANSINGDRIAAGTLDAAKIKAGSITASQIASGTITSNQIKAGGISSANIAAGAITGDKIAAGAIDANKIAANAITANMIRGGQLKSTNGATVFDLNAGTLTFNNNYGYIQRVASDKAFEITTLLVNGSADVREHLSSAFMVKKSDNSRKAGMLVSLYNPVGNKPTAQVDINADSLNLLDSQNTPLLSFNGSNTYLGNWNIYGWGDIPLAFVNGGLTAKDVGLEGHIESLKNIIERLCEKTGIMWM